MKIEDVKKEVDEDIPIIKITLTTVEARTLMHDLDRVKNRECIGRTDFGDKLYKALFDRGFRLY